MEIFLRVKVSDKNLIDDQILEKRFVPSVEEFYFEAGECYNGFEVVSVYLDIKKLKLIGELKNYEHNLNLYLKNGFEVVK